MALVILASAGTPETALIRVGGNGTQTGTHFLEGIVVPTYQIITRLIMENNTQVGGRCIARLTRPNALSGQTEFTVQLDADPGEVTRVEIPLGPIVVSTDPSSENFVAASLSWVSKERTIQDAVVAERIRNALTYTYNRLQEYPNNQKMLTTTWMTISDELAAKVAQKVVGGTIEVP